MQQSVCLPPDYFFEFLSLIEDIVEITIEGSAIVVWAEAGTVVWNYLPTINQFCASIGA